MNILFHYCSIPAVWYTQFIYQLPIHIKYIWPTFPYEQTHCDSGKEKTCKREIPWVGLGSRRAIVCLDWFGWDIKAGKKYDAFCYNAVFCWAFLWKYVFSGLSWGTSQEKQLPGFCIHVLFVGSLCIKLNNDLFFFFLHNFKFLMIAYFYCSKYFLQPFS